MANSMQARAINREGAEIYTKSEGNGKVKLYVAEALEKDYIYISCGGARRGRRPWKRSSPKRILAQSRMIRGMYSQSVMK